ncbi:MAG: YbhB/YbcL family Raf kinase inhibitor-like protein [Corynebacterium sp.]|nr:YbhB/YbcL family Raf kinase inhibitor-like protein [Corynebacterium sp.]
MSTYDSARFPAADPYAAPLRELPTFNLSSKTFEEGAQLPIDVTALGANRSPHLQWDSFPAGTNYFAITCLDPDAPTGSGFWHWGVINLPIDVTQIAEGIGDQEHLGLGRGILSLRNDSGSHLYYGPNPPAGWPHRYIWAVWSLEEPLELDRDTPMAQLGFNLNFKATGRAMTWGWYET